MKMKQLRNKLHCIKLRPFWCFLQTFSAKCCIIFPGLKSSRSSKHFWV